MCEIFTYVFTPKIWHSHVGKYSSTMVRIWELYLVLYPDPYDPRLFTNTLATHWQQLSSINVGQPVIL